MPPVGYVHSQETREKMSANHADLSGTNHPMFGKHHTIEARTKIGEIHRGNTYRRGSKHTPKSIEKMRLAKLGKPRPMSQAVYDGLKQAAEKRKGTTISEEQKVKISETVHAKLPEYRHKLVEAWADPERRARGTLENNPNWQGGVSYEPYCPKFNNHFKERVRLFFGNVCIECGTPQNGKKLSVHHVNFDKQSCCNNTLPLFVPLCHSCHTKTNYNRPYWEQHFTDMINNYYGGKCYLDTTGYLEAINDRN